MQGIIRLPKLVHIHPTEYRWIKNILNAAKKDAYIRRCILKGEDFNWINTYPEIKNDEHTGGTMMWSVTMAREILISGSKIKKHNKGFMYTLPFE
jgi:hypothetical protein